MLPSPMTLLEAALWESHARLDEARASGRGITPADDEAKAIVAAYLAAGPEHVSALRAFLQRLDGELSLLEGERERVLGAIEIAEGDRRRYRAHVLNALKATGSTSARALVGQLYIGRGKRTIEIRDVARLPEEFVQVMPELRRPREKEIRAALDAGEAVPGALLVDGELHLGVR